jgi:DNA-directed RNA polymerase subunit RPC12/RpoP
MNEKKTNQRECPYCGKKVNVVKNDFCPSCSQELFTPTIEKAWSYKVIAGVFLGIVIIYVLYLLLAPVLYKYLDMV